MHILLVEDNEDMRLATRGLLESAGHSVAAAEEAEEALGILASTGVPLEAVVTDVELPGMSGTELLRRLISAGSTLPLVVATSLQRFEALEELDPSNRVAFLRKPFSAEQLERALVEAQAGARVPILPLLKPRSVAVRRVQAQRPTGKTGFRLRSLLRQPLLGMPLLAVLVLGLGMVWKVCCAAPSLPPAPMSSVQRGASLHPEEPLGEISQLPSQLSWTPDEEALYYRAVLTTVDDAVLWQDIITTPAVALPDTVVHSLERAVVYHWFVEALDDDRRPLTRSERARFLVRLEPRPSSPSLGGPP